MIGYTDDHGLRDYRHPGVRLRAPLGPLPLVLFGLVWVLAGLVGLLWELR